MLPQNRTARMDRAGARTGKKKAHWEKTGGEGLGRGVYRRIEIPLPENLKNRKIRGACMVSSIPYFGQLKEIVQEEWLNFWQSECLSDLG
jgi:hypothetical protein